MNILAFNGSPRRDGNGAALITAVLAEARKHGHRAEIVHLYGKRITGCLACDRRACDGWTTAATACNSKDDMTAIVGKIIKADVLIVSTPVYMGQVSGPMKTFLDRWCVFFDRDFNVRFLPGKKVVTIVTSGAPPATYRDVSVYLKKLLAGCFKLKPAGSIVAGGLKGKRDVMKRAAVIRKARMIGSRL